MLGASSSEVPGESYARLKSRERTTGKWDPRKVKLEQTTSYGVKSRLIGFVSQKRTTFVFGPTLSEVSTRRYGSSKMRRKKQKGQKRSHVAQWVADTWRRRMHRTRRVLRGAGRRPFTQRRVS